MALMSVPRRAVWASLSTGPRVGGSIIDPRFIDVLKDPRQDGLSDSGGGRSPQADATRSSGRPSERRSAPRC